jgi:hypothetical protein
MPSTTSLQIKTFPVNSIVEVQVLRFILLLTLVKVKNPIFFSLVAREDPEE